MARVYYRISEFFHTIRFSGQWSRRGLLHSEGSGYFPAYFVVFGRLSLLASSVQTPYNDPKNRFTIRRFFRTMVSAWAASFRRR